MNTCRKTSIRVFQSLGLAATITIACGASAARAGGPPVALYVLDSASTYSQGCFGEPGQVPQCLCPIFLASDFMGTFGLELAPSEDPLFTQYNISGVDWTVTFGSPISITGSGVYKVGASPKGGNVHQLSLELSFNGGSTESFDSGLVPGGVGGSFPPIDIDISDGFGCPGKRIGITAAPGSPEPPADVAPTGGDGFVNVSDLLKVLGDWGLTGPRITDIDHSNDVGVGDLLEVLATWTG